MHERIVSLATRGLAYGLHVVLTAPRWHDLRPALQTSITGRLELRLNDPLDSVLDRELDTEAGQPGQRRLLRRPVEPVRPVGDELA